MTAHTVDRCKSCELAAVRDAEIWFRGDTSQSRRMLESSIAWLLPNSDATLEHARAGAWFSNNLLMMAACDHVAAVRS